MGDLGNKQIMARNIQFYMKKNGVTATDICTTLKIPPATFSDWINAKTYPRIDKIEMLANYFGIAKSELVEEGQSRRQTVIPPGFQPMPKMVKRPLVGRIACGDPILAEENIESYVDVPEEINCDFVLTCSGDSMIDAGISDGDQVYIHIQPEVENGQIAAVRIGDDATLKRIYWDGTTLMLMPANAKYSPKSFSGAALEGIQIEGKAVGFTHWF